MAHIIIVGNRNAGGGRASHALPLLLARLREAGHGITVVDEPTPDAASEAIAGIGSVDALIACGGDGTVHLTLQHALARGIPMGIVPAGSGDDGARAVGLPHGRRRHDVTRAIAHCVTNLEDARPVDVIRATAADGTSEAYLGVLACGFDSRVNARANGMRFPPGTAKYIVAMLRELRSFRPIPYRIELQDATVDIDGMLIAVGNGSTYGGGMRVCPGADVRDGLAEILVVGRLPRLAFLALFPRVFSGSHVRHPVTSVLSARECVFHAPGEMAYADGEPIGPAPIRLTVEERAVRIIGAP